MPYSLAMTSVARSEPGPHTWDDFIALDDEDLRELIDGELVEVEVPTNAHERIVSLITYFLEAWARPSSRGVVLGSGYKVRISTQRGVMPDVQFYRADNLPRGQDQGLVQGRPDLVVEVTSPSSVRFDRVKKLGWYASLGVPEYWIVDPQARTCERLVLEPAMEAPASSTPRRYVIADAIEGGATLRPDTFDGLELPLADLWAAVEALS
jgi:Uma2 family endonuclease